MPFLKKHKILIIAFIIMAIALVFFALFIRYIRKQNKQMESNPNIQAFLKTIRYAEGTSGVDGYRKLYGGKLFNDFSKHPNIAITAGGWTSTAAGAYQFLFKTWKRISLKLGLTDFSPESQDRGAIELIREKNALNDVVNGDFETAINKIRKIWASMPGAGYGQPEKSLATLKQKYASFGGQFA